MHVNPAPRVSFTGIKMNVEESTDISEADALGFKEDYIDVYSNSWGPSDFGFYVQGPGRLAERTMQTAVREVGAEKYRIARNFRGA